MKQTRENTLKHARKKHFLLGITLTLILVASTFMTAFPATSATEYTKSFATYSFLTVNPDPIGVNQAANVVFWQDSAPPQRSGEPYYGWKGIMVEITKPDGSVEKKGPFETDSVGGKYMLYT